MEMWKGRRVVVVLKQNDYPLFVKFLDFDTNFVYLQFNNGSPRTLSHSEIKEIKEDKKPFSEVRQ